MAGYTRSACTQGRILSPLLWYPVQCHYDTTSKTNSVTRVSNQCPEMLLPAYSCCSNSNSDLGSMPLFQGLQLNCNGNTRLYAKERTWCLLVRQEATHLQRSSGGERMVAQSDRRRVRLWCWQSVCFFVFVAQLCLCSWVFMFVSYVAPSDRRRVRLWCWQSVDRKASCRERV